MRRPLLIILTVILVLFCCLLVSSCLVWLVSGRGFLLDRGDIAVVTLKGEIYNPRPVVEQLEELEERDDIKAVVFRINSPGGTVSASEEIHGALRRLRTKKKVVASLGTVAASGGYYVACAAEKIVANRGTITGSIGVRLNHVNFKGILDWLRIEPRVLVSGEHKDLVSPFRPIGPEEEKILLEVLSGMHTQFKQVVQEARGLDEATLAEIADGRIFTGERGVALGLVDQIGTLQDAIDVAAGLAGIEGKPDVIYPDRRSAHWLQYLIDEAVRRVVASLAATQLPSLAFWRL